MKYYKVQGRKIAVSERTVFIPTGNTLNAVPIEIAQLLVTCAEALVILEELTGKKSEIEISSKEFEENLTFDGNEGILIKNAYELAKNHHSITAN